MKKCFKAFWVSDEGATAIEYGLIASVVAVGILSTLALLGPAVQNLFLAVVAAFPI